MYPGTNHTLAEVVRLTAALDGKYRAMAGDTSKALELLERAVDHGMYPYRFYRDFCSFMQPLRGLPEFDRIVAKAERRAAAFDA